MSSIKAGVSKDMLYIYTSKKKFVKRISLTAYCKSKRVSKKTVLDACNSFKGYGFVKDEYVSLTKIERWWTAEEVTEVFNKWLKKHLPNNIKKLKGMYGDKYNEDYLSSAILYIMNAIHSDRSINHFEQALIYKYKTSKLDEERLMKCRVKNGLTPDFMIVGKDGEEESYIRHYAMEDYWHSNYNCIDDYNSMKQFDIIGNILKERFSADQVDMFIEILQGKFDFKDLNTIPDFKYSTLIRKYKDVVVSLKKQDTYRSDMSNTNYLMELIKECWEEMIMVIERIKDEADTRTFKNLDDYTLKEFF